MIKSKTIPWSPLSEKHKDYIAAAMESRFCVAEGAIRSGKTIDHCIIAQNYLETCRDRIHLASGSTIGNAKLNIGVCNGFGLESLFRGRCHWGKYKGNEALILQTKTGEKIVVFAGGGKADSYKRILGNSYGLWIATEINEHYDSDDSRESFIKVALGRQIAAQDTLTLWDLNPCNPKHSIYSNYIDKYRDEGMPGYLYQHFTLDDNLSISEERKEQIRAQYEPGSVWEKRDLKGLRCIAEGLIYQHFADNTADYLIDDPLKWCEENGHHIRYVLIGVDFGGTSSTTTFVATGITDKLTVLALDQEYIDSWDLTPAKLDNLFSLFVQRVTAVYGRSKCYADNEESVLIRGLREAVKRDNLQCAVNNAKKMRIKDRIDLTIKLIAQKRLFVARRCEHLIDAWQTAVYDPKKYDDTRLDDGTSDIDSLDAFEYTLEPYYQQLLRYGERPYQSILR